MTTLQACIAGTGVVCALGSDSSQVLAAISEGNTGLKPLARFDVSAMSALPAGHCSGLKDDRDLPATHQLARQAADQAMAGCSATPDAIVLGVTTGGMAVTEELLKGGCTAPEAYRRHGIGTVAEDLAARFNCKGPVLTVSTACSSGSAAIALALGMMRTGHYRRVLAGGVDSLCRLTYFGFRSLQLIDPRGCRPLDKDRRGMSVAEGAGMLLLETRTGPSDAIQVLGAGLSCDAHHPAQPHPEGSGALAAMRDALRDAAMSPTDIDYINLHGTGTADNDRSEATAINKLFDHSPPPLSSIKGAVGHSLAASGAIEAVLAADCIERGLIPGNTGCRTPDPLLNVEPVRQTTYSPLQSVLSNSFGFGGNNAAVVIGRMKEGHRTPEETGCRPEAPLTLVGCSAVTGAGFTDPSLENLAAGIACRGLLDTRQLCHGLPPGVVRRLKRLSQMALGLVSRTQNQIEDSRPNCVFFGTGWGSLSETNDFLQGLFESNEKFSSPTDFIGSVHNAAAGQIALMTGATGPNLTLSGGDYSFEQALFCAQLLVPAGESAIVIGADETHEKLSPLFDPSVGYDPIRSDGGGALILKRTSDPVGPRVSLKYFATGYQDSPEIEPLVQHLGGSQAVRSKYGLILAGLPAAQKAGCLDQLEQFKITSGFTGPIINYRDLIGEFATSAAVAAVFAAALVRDGRLPVHGDDSQNADPAADAVLILGLGSALTAIEVCPA